MTAGFGGERIERRDRRVSPARYSGVAPGWSGGVERRGTASLFDANLEYIAGDLTAGGIPGAVDRLRRGTFETSLQLGVQRHLFAGLQLGLRAENAEHTYPFTPFPETFDVVAASLSPVVTWVTPWRAGAVRVRGSAAALSLVHRAYSRSKAGSSDGDYAGPTEWASGTLETSWLVRDRSRVSWKLAMRATAWSHRTEGGAATVETRASVSGRVRLGRIK